MTALKPIYGGPWWHRQIIGYNAPPPDPERRKMDDPADCQCDWCRIARLTAELDRLRADNARLREPYRFADRGDWNYLEQVLDHVSKQHPADVRPKFWMQVLKEARAARAALGPEQSPQLKEE